MKVQYNTEITCYIYLHKVDQDIAINITTNPEDLDKVSELISYKESSITYPGVLPVEERKEDATGDVYRPAGGSDALDTGTNAGDSAGETLEVEG